MIYFRSDYSTVGHPRMLKALTENLATQSDGYSLDTYCQNAISLIKKQIGNPDVDVHFIPGGTQCNTIALSAFIRPYHGIISPKSSHICTHETGAIEATGHCILHTYSEDGKIYPEEIEAIMEAHEDEHCTLGKIVSIAFPTEIGTIYSKAELIAIREVCNKYNLLLYVDGARMAVGLGCAENDIDLNFLSNITDAFYIGGTKNGALLGEAFVICNPNLKEDFRYLIKQRGALLAKGMIMGIQFEELFIDGLYFQLGKHTAKMGNLLTSELKKLNLDFLVDSPTNQVFPILPISIIEELEKEYFFYRWQKISNDKWAIRLVTSWQTTEEEVLAVVNSIKKNIAK